MPRPSRMLQLAELLALLIETQRQPIDQGPARSQLERDFLALGYKVGVPRSTAAKVNIDDAAEAFVEFATAIESGDVSGSYGPQMTLKAKGVFVNYVHRDQALKRLASR